MTGAWIKPMAIGIEKSQSKYVKKAESTKLHDLLEIGHWEIKNQG